MSKLPSDDEITIETGENPESEHEHEKLSALLRCNLLLQSIE